MLIQNQEEVSQSRPTSAVNSLMLNVRKLPFDIPVLLAISSIGHPVPHSLFSSDVFLVTDVLPRWKASLTNIFPSQKSFNPSKFYLHINRLRSIYITQFIKQLLCNDIKTSTAFYRHEFQYFHSMFQFDLYMYVNVGS